MTGLDTRVVTVHRPGEGRVPAPYVCEVCQQNGDHCPHSLTPCGYCRGAGMEYARFAGPSPSPCPDCGTIAAGAPQ